MQATISKITVYTHANELGGKVWNPAIRWKTKYAVFIVVENDHGVYGIGECWCFDSSPDTLVAFLRTEVLPHFVGRSINDVDALFVQLTERATLTARHGLLSSALSGLDLALGDLLSKLRSLPLHCYLNSQSASGCYTYASGGLYGENKDVLSLCKEMNAMASDGFNLLKLKIGALSVEEDLERVNAVIESLPSNVNLIIDGVYSYSVNSAMALYRELPESRIEAFQSPLKASDISGMTLLNEAGIPVMATEAEYRPEIHELLVERNAITFLQTAPVACGGIRRVQALHEMIEDTSIKLSLEVSSTAIAFHAASHLAAAFESIAHVEYHYVHQVFFDQLPSAIGKDALGEYVLPETPGLGLQLDTEQIRYEFELSC